MKYAEGIRLLSELDPSLRKVIMKCRDRVSIDITGNFHINLLSMDKELAIRDPEYNPDKCTYKDKTDISTSDYLFLAYGEKARKIVLELL